MITDNTCKECGKEKCGQKTGDTCHFTKCHGHPEEKKEHDCIYKGLEAEECPKPDTPKVEEESMKKAIILVAQILLFVGLIWLVSGWKIYQYHDCIKVGHAKFYCVMKMGEK